MPNYTSLPWIRRTEVVTDGENVYVKVWLHGSDDIIVVLTSEFHRFAHKAMNHADDVERQERELEAALAEDWGQG
jgi:hypothetical protein